MCPMALHRFVLRLGLLGVLLSGAAAEGKMTRFDMRDGGLRNLVEFVSDALLEKVVGISNAVSGWLELDPDRLADGVRGEFEIDVRTFETGVEARNEQFREKYLGAGEHPVANFTLTTLLSSSKPRLGEGQPVVLRVEGTLRAKGVVKPQAVLVKLTYFKESELTRQRLSGNLMKASASFDVDTQLFGINIPENFRARLSRFVQVTADLVGTDRPPLTPAEAAAAKATPKAGGK